MKKYALVTGASRGIGRETAIALAAAGYDLIITALKNEDKLKETAAAAEAASKRADFAAHEFICDAGSSADVRNLFSSLKALGIAQNICLLVNNAGISSFNLVQDISDDEWHRVIDVNLSGPFYMCRELVPYMIRKKSGCIINISSYWGRVGSSMESAYSAAKGGLDAFTLSLAKELKPSGITVCSLSCEFINTEMNAGFTDDEIRDVLRVMPSGKVISPREVAKMVCILTDTDHRTEGRVYCMNEMLKKLRQTASPNEVYR